MTPTNNQIKIIEDIHHTNGTSYTIYVNDKCIASQLLEDDKLLIEYGGNDWINKVNETFYNRGI